MNCLDRLAARQLLVVTGKGGVGKSTVAAVLGRMLADVGRRVLVLEVDPRDSLAPLLGIEPSGGAFVQAGPRLWAQNLGPTTVLDQVVREQVGVDLITRRVLASAVYRQFAEGAPGLKELAVLGHAMRLVRGIAGAGAPDEIDLVVLDAPATGHGLSLLAAPGLVAEVITDGPFGRMAGELSSWTADESHCGVVVVALAEEMPVQEALESIEALGRRLDRRPDVVLVNGLYPPTADAVTDGDADATEVETLWRRRRAVNDRELARLRAAWDGGLVELPLLPLDRGRELVAALEQALARGLEAVP